MTAFRSAAVIAKDSEDLLFPLLGLVRLLERQGVRPLLDGASSRILGGSLPAHAAEDLGKMADVAVVLGGDGTTLGAARRLAPYGVPFIGVNAGRLGFITDVTIDAMEELLTPMLRGLFVRDERTMLEGTVLRDGAEIFRCRAVNDAGITNGRIGGMVEYTIRVNGQEMSTQRADCIICSTTTGSTAYALASGGPILHPSLKGMVLVPVAPHTLTNRPIVLPGDAVVEMELLGAKEGQAYFDMQEFLPMETGDRLLVRAADNKFTLLHPVGYNHFDILRQKLNWNAMPEGSGIGASAGKRKC